MRKLNDVQLLYIRKYIADERIKYLSVEQCPICRSSGFAVVAEKDQFGIPLRTGCCKGCGVLLSLEQLDPASTAIFYDEYYRKIYEGVDGPTLDHQFYKQLFAGAVPIVPAFIELSSHVFEFGSGGGWNLLPYKRLGIQHTGFDYDSAMIRFGRENYGLDLHEGGIDAALASGVKADYVILSHVLEHVANPVEFLRQLASIIKPEGLLRITVPCIDYMKFLGGSGTSHDFGLVLQNAHNFTFSEATLKRVVLEAGFAPVVLVGGYCLAKHVGARPAPKSAAAPVTGFATTVHLLQRSEELLDFKAKILALVPHRLQNLTLYLYQLTRPIEMLKYVLVSRTPLGRFFISKAK